MGDLAISADVGAAYFLVSGASVVVLQVLTRAAGGGSVLEITQDAAAPPGQEFATTTLVAFALWP